MILIMKHIDTVLVRVMEKYNYKIQASIIYIFINMCKNFKICIILKPKEY